MERQIDLNMNIGKVADYRRNVLSYFLFNTIRYLEIEMLADKSRLKLLYQLNIVIPTPRIVINVCANVGQIC